MFSLNEQTQAALADWMQAKDAIKTLRASMKQEQENDSIYASAKEEYDDAAARFREEKKQWEAKHERTLKQFAELRQAEKEAHATFDDFALTAVQTGTQLSLFHPSFPDTKLGIHLSTKVKPLDDQMQQ